jgi:hypothetical protein
MSEFSPPEPLRPDHRLGDFDCGKPALNDFLRLHALGRQKAMLSRTYVVARGGLVVGYYTLAHVAVRADDVPKKLGRGMPTAIPAILLARLGVDVRVQGRGLGRSMFVDAVRRTWAVMCSDAVPPVRLFVVDAMDDEASAFYERFDMLPSPVKPLRLYLSYKSLEAVLGS